MTRRQKTTRTRSLVRRTALAGAALLLSGCYKYVPSEMSRAPVGDEIRLTVTQDGAAELARVTEVVELVPRIRGTVEGNENGSLLLRVPIQSDQDPLGRLDIGQLVRVPTNQILSVERRELDTGRTALLTGGLAGAAAIVVFGILDIGGPGADDPPDDVELFNLISFRIR